VKIHLDEDRCVSSGQCVMAAPDVFDQREEDGVAFLLTDSAMDADQDSVRRAARVCPAMAITLDAAQ
jgi:ferredoxin